MVVDAAEEVAEQLAGPDPACPPGYPERSARQVVEDLLLAYAERDETLIACSYHPAAFIVDDQGVIEDGIDSFDVRRGRIRRQTSHGLITFTGPPAGP